MKAQAPDLDALLTKWKEAHKKGLLSFRALLYLSEQPSYGYQISTPTGITLSQRLIERKILVLQSSVTAERIQSVLASIPEERS